MLLLLFLACGAPATTEQPSPDPTEVRDADLDPRNHAIPRSYDESLEDAYPCPNGFTRVDATPFTSWLRTRKIGPFFQPLLTWQGEAAHHPGRLVRVGLSGHNQTAVASTVRMRAEYLNETSAPVVFHVDSDTTLSHGPNEEWKGWLTQLFTQTSPDTLRLDTTPATTPQPGDVLVQREGVHAALILDVATRGEDIVVLVGEGHVPAQYFHVEHGPYIYWWPWHAVAGVEGFHEPLPASSLRRWKNE